MIQVKSVPSLIANFLMLILGYPFGFESLAKFLMRYKSILIQVYLVKRLSCTLVEATIGLKKSEGDQEKSTGSYETHFASDINILTLNTCIMCNMG